MASKKNKYATSEAKLHFAISMGASIVIVGALFKILHLGGIYGSIMIGVGLGVEAFLFFLLGFFPPQPEIAWEKVYPQLREGGVATPANAVPESAGSSSALDRVVNEKIGPELIESLGAGLRSFSEKVSAISNIADASLATKEFTTKVKTISGSVDGLNQAFSSATSQLTEFSAGKMNAKAYNEQIANLAKNISALNAVYELELQDSSVHLKTMNKFYQNISLTMSNFEESVEDSKEFKDSVAKLAKNITSLNSIYGNMLSAMNQPRA